MANRTLEAAGLDADLAEDGDGGVRAHPLVFLVGQGLRGGDGDAVASVDAHRVEKFSMEQTITALSAWGRMTSISELFPADQALLDEDRVGRAEAEGRTRPSCRTRPCCRRCRRRSRPS